MRLSKSFCFAEKHSGGVQADTGPMHGPRMAGGPGGGHGGHGGGHGSQGRPGSAGGRYSVTLSVSARNPAQHRKSGAAGRKSELPLFGTSVALGGFGHHGGASA